ncbi:ABC transporter [[Clostridium] symbiosum]|jgi:ABC-2 type transport system permease protein|uniref:ABC-2 transporter permease n=1 Tax=Clostridium symbiosum TaxID=1512 RepID=UPI000E46B160|nr:ABC-2 transporter permease [[Clostridium] symbiosum]RHB65372.1 ABC transporter [[Clostridium] symbiosum]
MTAVLKHELANYFHSLTAYIFGAFLLVFVGIGAMLYNIQAAVSNFEYVLQFVSLGFVVIVPILTMRVIAEERKQKTDQLLYSLPITTSQVVVGKYLALLVVFFIPLCIVSLYPLIFAQFGDVYLIILFNYYSVSLAEHISASAMGSVISLCALAVILGLVIRFLTGNEGLAFSISLLLIIIIGIAGFVDISSFEGLLPKIMNRLSLFERFYSFVNGVFDFTSIVYFVSVIVFFLFLSVQSLEKRRYN